MSPEPLIAVLGVAIVVNLALMASVAAAVLGGRGPLRHLVGARPAGKEARGPRPEARETAPAATAQPAVRLQRRDRSLEQKADQSARLLRLPDEMDAVIGSLETSETYNKTIRIIAWSFIIATFVIVATTGLWRAHQADITIVLVLGGIFVLVFHELLPARQLRPIRLLFEGSAAILFLTTLVMFTGRSASPFFFIYPLVVAAAALGTGGGITLVLTLEAVVAYTIAAIPGPLSGDEGLRVLASLASNLTALVLLTYAAMVISREQRRTHDAAVRLSTVDSLTDLYNRAYFFNALDREIARSRRFRRDFCLLMMDLDGLKAVNDRYGHFHGDAVLRGVAEVIRSGLRNVDVASRYGGDEFVALLPETDPSGAYVVAEKIRQGVTELLVEAAGQQIRTSLSIGVVSFPDDGGTADELMIAADEAMYSSKRLGKNRVVGFADVGDPAPASPGAYRPATTPGFRPLSPEARGSNGPT